jgi:hypothetical protein
VSRTSAQNGGKIGKIGDVGADDRHAVGHADGIRHRDHAHRHGPSVQGHPPVRGVAGLRGIHQVLHRRRRQQGPVLGPRSSLAGQPVGAVGQDRQFVALGHQPLQVGVRQEAADLEGSDRPPLDHHRDDAADRRPEPSGFDPATRLAIPVRRDQHGPDPAQVVAVLVGIVQARDRRHIGRVGVHLSDPVALPEGFEGRHQKRHQAVAVARRHHPPYRFKPGDGRRQGLVLHRRALDLDLELGLDRLDPDPGNIRVLFLGSRQEDKGQRARGDQKRYNTHQDDLGPDRGRHGAGHGSHTFFRFLHGRHNREYFYSDCACIVLDFRFLRNR